MTTLLSVDWDFFADMSGENEPKAIYLYDWGHSEAHHPDLLNILWVSRAAGFQHFNLPLPTTTGEESTFWSRFRFSDDCKLFIAESHMNAAKPEVFEGISRVLNYDAHHDCGYNGRNDVAETMRVACEDWLLAYDLMGAEIEVVYPRWRSYALEAEPKPAIDIDRRVDDGEPVDELIDRIFICRSGSWVPPWLDDKWETFVKDCPIEKPVVLGNLTMVRNWDVSEVEQDLDVRKRLLAMSEEDNK